MCDAMSFPDTAEEFMESYKVIDAEGIYMSKGAELVPIFRMKQWFEHEQQEGEWTERKVFDVGESTITEMQSAKCSKCGKYHTTPYMYYFDNFDYCPKCGAKMKGGK